MQWCMSHALRVIGNCRKEMQRKGGEMGRERRKTIVTHESALFAIEML